MRLLLKYFHAKFYVFFELLYKQLFFLKSLTRSHNSSSPFLSCKDESLLSRVYKRYTVSDEFCHWSGSKRVENRLTGAKSVGGLGEGDRLEKEEEEGRLAGRRREGAAPRRARTSASIHPCGRRCTTRPAASRCYDLGISSCIRKLRASRVSSENFWTEFDCFGRRNSSAKPLHDSYIVRIISMIFFFSVGVNRFCAYATCICFT